MYRKRERRKEIKLSADELAKRLNKDRSTIYRYENGEIENLPLDVLEPIALALDTTPAYLMGWKEYNTSESKENFTFVRPNTLAAHFEGEEFSEDEMKEILQFAEFVKSRRK